MLRTVLKPAFTALRIERYYRPAPHGGAEIWAAVTGPAGSAHSAEDARANSMAQLGDEATTAEGALWWWSILATDVDGGLPSGSPLQVAELWPPPTPGTQLLVATLQHTTEQSEALYGLTSNGYGGLGVTPGPGPGPACVSGSVASSCLKLWDASTPLPVGTEGTAPKDGAKNFTLFAAAPVLSSGWTLVGDLSKLVPCSPQRFVAPSTRSLGAPLDTDLTGGTAAGLKFTVLGSPKEKVSVTVVAPPKAGKSALDGHIMVVDAVVGTNGEATVQCAGLPAPDCEQLSQ